MSQQHIIAEYLLETPLALEAAAASLAGEQSTGTFTRVRGETDRLRQQFSATVESIERLEICASPSLPGSLEPQQPGTVYQRGTVRISFPLDNVGPNLPTIVSTVAGNLFELRQLSGLRLLDLELPESLAEYFPGPQFGIDGTRRLTNVWQRPIIGTIVKPSVGLTPEQTADLVRTLGEAGVDFVKDDELMANPPHSPLAARVDAVMKVVNDLAQTTGRKLMFAFNISDQLDRMLEHHAKVVSAGGTCVMVSLNSVGYAGVEFLRRRCALPIHGHRNGWGIYYRHPALGIDFTAYQKLWRLAGVDHLHVNGLANKFCETDESVVRSIKACLTPMLGGYRVMPVVSSGQWGGQAPDTYRQTQTVDLMYLAGGGILAHPAGPAAGVTAIRQAWEAAQAGEPLEEYSQSRDELRQSLEFFGRVTRAS
ncbi:MAG TPA: ribulose-bisphosphate carboxylase large subunit family protein [Lacipirellulaceae bacterium]|nr:ribulose-bisphosphate carboxylase large subunit family protein [Lacipirellulaceae bacterium]